MHLHNNGISALISPVNPLVIEKLNALGVNTVFTKAVSGMISYEQYHADMQMLVIDSFAFICKEADYLKEVAIKYALKPVFCDNIGHKYPGNVSLNAALVGDKLICREDSLSENVKDFCTEKKIKILNVKQGYAKCSTLVLNDNSIITADVNINKIALENHIDSLLIKPGYINLEGADYGFIGGAGMVVGDMVIFFGDINIHPDSERIITYLLKYDMCYVSLTDEMLTDLGGAVIL